MQKKIASKFISGLKIAIVAYIVCGILLYFLQEKFIFHPQKLPASHVFNFNQPYREINLPVNAEKNLNIVQFTVPDSVRRGVVLYFHGNRNNIERYAPYVPGFTKNHFEVWMLDYPGFGKSTGKRNEQMLYADAAILYKMARAKFAKENIIIYGKSLGTAIASHLASEKDCKRLLVETPYYSMDALMKHYAFIYPVNWMAKYHLPTNEYFKKVEVPITIFHGTHDEVIPFKQAKRLAKENAGVKLVAIEKGRHNNLNDSPIFKQELDRILQLP